MSTLDYYCEDGSYVNFNKYTIDTDGVVRNKKTTKIIQTHKSGKYNRCGVLDNDGKTYNILIARVIASTFLGPPPTLTHTADHKNKNRDDDTLDNIRWLCKSEQSKNRVIPETLKNALIIVKDANNKTANDWVEYLKEQQNHMGRQYTISMITKYAQNKQHGFSYKEYPDLPDEIWKEVVGSKNGRGGRWEISNMNRMKYITKYAINVLSGERIGLNDAGYPIVVINGKQLKCHILSFMTFYPEEYANKKSNEMVLHEDDDKLDFRPHKLRLGTPSENTKDAYENGKYDGKKTSRMKCVSYIHGELEKEHDSQRDAVSYLKSLGFEKASKGSICDALSGKLKTVYGRTWKMNT